MATDSIVGDGLCQSPYAELKRNFEKADKENTAMMWAITQARLDVQLARAERDAFQVKLREQNKILDKLGKRNKALELENENLRGQLRAADSYQHRYLELWKDYSALCTKLSSLQS